MFNLQNKFKKVGRETLIIITGVLVVIYIVQTALAGSLTPPGPTAPTMQTVEEIFDPIASDSYDSSSFLPDPNGNALEIIKCIISKLNTGTCP